MRNMFEFDPAPSRLQVVSDDQAGILACLARERRAAAAMRSASPKR